MNLKQQSIMAANVTNLRLCLVLCGCGGVNEGELGVDHLGRELHGQPGGHTALNLLSVTQHTARCHSFHNVLLAF